MNRALHLSVKNSMHQTPPIQGVQSLERGRDHVHGEVAAAHVRAGMSRVFPRLIFDRDVRRVQFSPELVFDERFGGV